jgi:hypothetical protein
MMKKILFYSMTLLLGLVLSSGSCGKEDALEPDGSPVNPFQVATVADLQKVGTGIDGWDRDKHYIQVAHIDLNALPVLSPICYNHGFTGSYDGQGFSISNFAIDLSIAKDNENGLFSRIGDGGVVKNVALINVDIQVERETGFDTGGIAGLCYGTIQNCFVTGIIEGETSVGGITGSVATSGKVENCYTTCRVSGSQTHIGGITGSTSMDAIIQYCYATGNITGDDLPGGVGGVVGTHIHGGSVKNCVALNASVVSAYDSEFDIGRVIGDILSPSLMSDNYGRGDMRLQYDFNGACETLIPDSDKDGKHGESVFSEQCEEGLSGLWWGCDPDHGVAKFPASSWSFASGRLPHLLTTTGAPFKIEQNPVLKYL